MIVSCSGQKVHAYLLTSSKSHGKIYTIAQDIVLKREKQRIIHKIYMKLQIQNRRRRNGQNV